MPVDTGVPPHVRMNFTGMVLPSLKTRTGTAHVPPVAVSAPSIGGRKPSKLYEQAALRVTVKVQLAEFPDESVAVQVTVVVPIGKFEPDGGTQLTLVTLQLSEVVGFG